MPEISIHQTRAYAEQYDEETFGASFGRYLQEREVETFFSLMSASDKKVLDVGAGTGKLSIPLILGSRQVVSADFSSEMLSIAGRNADRANVALRSIITDAHHLCFDDGSFDCVVSSRMLMHLSDWRGGLSELCRVSNSRVIIEFPPFLSSSGLDSVVKRIRHLFSRGTHPYKAFLVGSVTKELEKRNFRVVALRRGFFLPTAVHRRLDRPGVSSGIEKVCRKLGLVSLLGAPVTVMASKTGEKWKGSNPSANQRLPTDTRVPWGGGRSTMMTKTEVPWQPEFFSRGSRKNHGAFTQIAACSRREETLRSRAKPALGPAEARTT